MTKRLYALPLIIFSLLTPLSALSQPIRVAIIDSFAYQKFVTTKYKSFYEKGLKLAKAKSQTAGFALKTKIFQYDNNDLSIFKKIEQVKKWKPDVVIGPRDSNHFLLLKGKFKDVFVISPFATSILIPKMGKNFYSLTYDDQFTSNVFEKFIKKHFPGSHLKIIANAECKSCIELSQNLSNKFNKISSLNTFIPNNIANLDLDNLLKTSKNFKNIVFILPNDAHSSAVLMSRITDNQNKKSFFIGGDGWGQWEDTEVGKLPATFPYEAYHLTPWSIKKKTIHNAGFINYYKKTFNSHPKDTLSFIIYNTVTTITDLAARNDNCSASNIKKKILCSFLIATKTNYNSLKHSEYFAFKIKYQTQSLFEILNIATHD